MKKLPDFDTILNLVNTHGEPYQCTKQNCKDCRKISEARFAYYGKKGSRDKNFMKKFKYTVIDEDGNEVIFYEKQKAALYMHTGIPIFEKIVNTDKSHKGFKVLQEKYKYE